MFIIAANRFCEYVAIVSLFVCFRFIIEDAALYISDNCTASCVDLLKSMY